MFPMVLNELRKSFIKKMISQAATLVGFVMKGTGVGLSVWVCIGALLSTDFGLCCIVCWGLLGKSDSVVFNAVLKVMHWLCGLYFIVGSTSTVTLGALLGTLTFQDP